VIYVFLLFLAFFVYFAVLHDKLAEMRSWSWPNAGGVIETVQEHGYPENGRQTYYCTYLFRVDGVRQGGVFAVWGKDRQLKEIQNVLKGYAVTVTYNPEDCTECRIEESQILGFSVSNSTH
jgi:hypothetical protein